MNDNKKKFIGLTILSTILSILGVVIYKFFPALKQRCQDLKDQYRAKLESSKPKKKKK